ncbi:hypothetical protein [Ruegeria atlantica]|uniref:hypothetical protein n=1 Tax=Ruegeria atlantica TaxID=81569 RepID=UPI00147A6AEF|nr:hypothetical protein [Ruegeria atlantica]
MNYDLEKAMTDLHSPVSFGGGGSQGDGDGARNTGVNGSRGSIRQTGRGNRAPTAQEARNTRRALGALGIIAGGAIAGGVRAAAGAALGLAGSSMFSSDPERR